MSVAVLVVLADVNIRMMENDRVKDVDYQRISAGNIEAESLWDD